MTRPKHSTANDLELALHLADEADALTSERFGAQDLVVTDKPDLTPVSDADLAVERMVRTILSTERPEDHVLGEEFGGEPLLKGRQWVIDPIDGTKNFVRGVPVWASLISLLHDGVPVVGVVSAPALGRRWWAGQGLGAFTRSLFSSPNPTAISVSTVQELTSASLSFSSFSGWKKHGLREQFLELTDTVWRVRGYGDFLSYCLVAEGAVDIAAEPEVSLWDLAALDILVREAGGQFSGLNGAPGPHNGNAIASNGFLHSAAISSLSPQS